MSLNPVMFPYKPTLSTCLKISQSLRTTQILHHSDYRHSPTDLVVNWGSGQYPASWTLHEGRCLNKPSAVASSVMKDRAFGKFEDYGVRIPDRTRDIGLARDWIRDGYFVFSRAVLEGKDGDGITVCQTLNDLEQVRDDTRLWTRYVDNDREFRVHVFRGVPIMWTQKKKVDNAPLDTSPYVKSGRSWYMAHLEQADLFSRSDAIDQAVNANRALGLDFSAVDIGWNSRENKAYVFETNTAPGGFGPRTLQAYVNAINKACEEIS